MTELENQLKATEATPNTDACLEWHTKIMTQLFAIYFRILKKGMQSAIKDGWRLILKNDSLKFIA